MKTCERMRGVVTRLARKHGLDLTAETAHLRLEMPDFDCLVIRKIGECLISVGHYYRECDELKADPEVVFFISAQGWIPIEIVQVLGGLRVYATLSDDGKTITGVDPPGQAELAEFAEMWARNIEAQGWLKYAEKWGPGNPKPPDIGTLMLWEAEGGCEAACPDRCWVEPDGYCEHGKPSWLIALGLI